MPLPSFEPPDDFGQTPDADGQYYLDPIPKAMSQGKYFLPFRLSERQVLYNWIGMTLCIFAFIFGVFTLWIARRVPVSPAKLFGLSILWMDIISVGYALFGRHVGAAILGHHVGGFGACQVQGFIDGLWGIVAQFSMVAFTAERYITINLQKDVTMLHARWILCAIFGLGFLCTSFSFMMQSWATVMPSGVWCLPSMASGDWRGASIALTALASFATAMIGVLWMYVQIYQKFRKVQYAAVDMVESNFNKFGGPAFDGAGADGDALGFGFGEPTAATEAYTHLDGAYLPKSEGLRNGCLGNNDDLELEDARPPPRKPRIDRTREHDDDDEDDEMVDFSDDDEKDDDRSEDDDDDDSGFDDRKRVHQADAGSNTPSLFTANQIPTPSSPDHRQNHTRSRRRSIHRQKGNPDDVEIKVTPPPRTVITPSIDVDGLPAPVTVRSPTSPGRPNGPASPLPNFLGDLSTSFTNGKSLMEGSRNATTAPTAKYPPPAYTSPLNSRHTPTSPPPPPHNSRATSVSPITTLLSTGPFARSLHSLLPSKRTSGGSPQNKVGPKATSAGSLPLPSPTSPSSSLSKPSQTTSAPAHASPFPSSPPPNSRPTRSAARLFTTLTTRRTPTPSNNFAHRQKRLLETQAATLSYALAKQAFIIVVSYYLCILPLFLSIGYNLVTFEPVPVWVDSISYFGAVAYTLLNPLLFLGGNRMYRGAAREELRCWRERWRKWVGR